MVARETTRQREQYLIPPAWELGQEGYQNWDTGIFLKYNSQAVGCTRVGLVSPIGSKIDFLGGTLFFNQLHDFSLLSSNSFLKSLCTKKNPWHQNNFRRFPVIFIFKVGSVPLWQGARPYLLLTKDFCITSSAIILKNSLLPFFSGLFF